MCYVPLFYSKSFCSIQSRDVNSSISLHVGLFFCFSGVQTPHRPEGTEEGQREEQTQRRAAEPQHHHVWGQHTSSPSLHWFKPAPWVCCHCYNSFFCISIQTLKYLSKMPCSRQSPDIVKDFLTTMMPHKLTKSVRSHKGTDVILHQMKSITINSCTVRYTHWIFFFPPSGQKNCSYWTTGRRQQWKFSLWVSPITIITRYHTCLQSSHLVHISKMCSLI